LKHRHAGGLMLAAGQMTARSDTHSGCSSTSDCGVPVGDIIQMQMADYVTGHGAAIIVNSSSPSSGRKCREVPAATTRGFRTHLQSVHRH
jgi:hypothetical protein